MYKVMKDFGYPNATIVVYFYSSLTFMSFDTFEYPKYIRNNIIKPQPSYTKTTGYYVATGNNET